METRIQKNLRGEWSGETTIPYKGDLKLRVVTTKRSNGNLETFVSAIKEDGGFWTHRMYADFSARVVSEKCRVTERRVTEQHQRALAQVDDMFYSADLHYANQAA